MYFAPIAILKPRYFLLNCWKRLNVNLHMVFVVSIPDCLYISLTPCWLPACCCLSLGHTSIQRSLNTSIQRGLKTSIWRGLNTQKLGFKPTLRRATEQCTGNITTVGTGLELALTAECSSRQGTVLLLLTLLQSLTGWKLFLRILWIALKPKPLKPRG